MSWLSAIVFFPIVGLILIALLPKSQQGLIRAAALLATFVPWLLSLLAWVGFDTAYKGMQFVEQRQWIDVGFIQFNYELGVDGFSLPLVLLATTIMFVAAFASFSIKERVKEYFLWFLLLQIGLTGVFVALDLFLFFLFFELTLIPMFFLIGIWGGKERKYASFKFLIYTGLGSIIMILAFFALMMMGVEATQGTEVTFNMIRLAEILGNPMYQSAANFDMRAWVFLALFLAFAIKLPIFPFHTWLPDAHVQAPTPASMILAGVLLKMGAYGLLRIGFGILPDAAAHFATLIAILGVINILYGALLALVQKDLKKLIAYSSISHMGIVLLGMASFTQQGMQGAVFQMVSHGFIAALLFFSVGAIYERTHTRMLADLGGLSKPMPVLAGFMLAAMLASAGLPGFSGFVSELMAFLGMFSASVDIIPHATAIAAVGAIGIIFTAAYLLWAIQRTTFGPVRDAYQNLADLRAIEYVPMVTLLGFSLLIGVYPSLLNSMINTTIADFLLRIGG